MTRARLDGLLLLLLGCLVFLGLGIGLERTSRVSMVDFGGAYYSARCLLQNLDPYNSADLLEVYGRDVRNGPADPASVRLVVELNEHLPTTFPLTIPFGLIPWGPAHILWMILTAASFLLAAYLIWDIAAWGAPVAAGALICVFLANSEMLLEIGNPAGIAIGLCVIAVWCFMKDKFVRLGILCLAASLAVTPHDAGFVWLYFLLAGGRFRKWALQSLAVTVIVSLPLVIWVGHVAPHWTAELSRNLQLASAHGAPNDPGPATDARFPGSMIVDLQSAFSLIRDDPHFYDPTTYLFCAPLFLAWIVTSLRRHATPEGAWLALAAIAPLSMMPLYHRMHDTRLLLLALPAFAILWARGGLTKWISAVVTGVGLALIGVIPERVLAVYTTNFQKSISGLSGLLTALVLTRPAPLILLAMSIFYLWAYVRFQPATKLSEAHDVRATAV